MTLARCVLVTFIMTPTQITYRGFDSSEAVNAAIERHAEHLRHLAPNIVDIRVSLELPHQRHRHGNHFRVLLDVHVPGHEIVVGRTPNDRTADEDVYVALHRAFDIAARQLEKLRH